MSRLYHDVEPGKELNKAPFEKKKIDITEKTARCLSENMNILTIGELKEVLKASAKADYNDTR
ncbi:Transcriptional regulator, AraC family / Glycoside hydrolase [Listeria monocytogenes]|nr:Transcriptional regulator, AraC family / Glycoside hydrolase [Listeria monocytogenes]